MRIAIAGGGTGGHLFPGLAIAEEIKKRDSSAEVIFIGTEYGIEASVIPREGYAIRYLKVEGVVGKSLIKKIKGSIKMLFSVYDAWKMLRDMRPDAVAGVGGYASFSPVLAACMMSVPTLIAEQNIVPGLANRLLSKIVDAICVTYYESVSLFPREKTFFTGNPVRTRVFSGNREAAYGLFALEKGRFTIFVFGGSSGANTINKAVCDALAGMSDIRDKIQFLHQTGKHDYEAVREAYRKNGFKGTVAAFIHEMPEAYAAADLVISRAGATTLAELTAIGKPALLIPYPYAAGHHQELNARKLSEMGAARLIHDHELNGEALATNIKELYLNTDMREQMQKAGKTLGSPDAAEKVVDIMVSLFKVRRGRRPGSGASGRMKNV